MFLDESILKDVLLDSAFYSSYFKVGTKVSTFTKSIIFRTAII